MNFMPNYEDEFNFGQSFLKTVSRFEKLPEGSKEDYYRSKESNPPVAQWTERNAANVGCQGFESSREVQPKCDGIHHRWICLTSLPPKFVCQDCGSRV